jgi:hypothetical protein
MGSLGVCSAGGAFGGGVDGGDIMNPVRISFVLTETDRVSDLADNFDRDGYDRLD